LENRNFFKKRLDKYPRLCYNNDSEREVIKMPTKHNAPYLIARYEQLQRCADNETNLLIRAMYRDEMRQIKKILLKKYKITLDK
jgi:hypothetical protein